MNAECFFGYCIKNMVSHNVTIEITKRLNNSKAAYSFFSPKKNPVFRVNYFKNNFEGIIKVFIHEYSHFEQWKDQSKIFNTGISATAKYDRWLNKTVKTTKINYLRNIQKMELDCDRRAVELIKKFNLDIDIENYIQESNSYIIAYNYVHEKRKFFSSFPYHRSDLIKFMPSRHLTEDELSLCFPEHREIFLKHCK